MNKKIRRDTKARPKSLILPIPAQIRDIMKFEHGTEVTIEVCLNENKEMYLRVQEKID